MCRVVGRVKEFRLARIVLKVVNLTEKRKENNVMINKMQTKLRNSWFVSKVFGRRVRNFFTSSDAVGLHNGQEQS